MGFVWGKINLKLEFLKRRFWIVVEGMKKLLEGVFWKIFSVKESLEY